MRTMDKEQLAIERLKAAVQMSIQVYQQPLVITTSGDKDSPVTFKADGHTVHDFERRFQAEDDGLICADDKLFRWSMLDEELNYRWF